jgi:hypothetical protein
MKLKIAAVAALLLAGVAAPALAAQGSQSVTANATVITPISMSASAMDFGKLVMDASNTGGTLTLTAGGARSVLGGVNLVGGNTGTAGVVNVTAQSGNTFSVSLPGSAVSLSGPGGATMSVDTFTAGQSLTTVAATGTAQAFTIGATLHASASQAPGAYTGSFTVTAAYD